VQAPRQGQRPARAAQPGLHAELARSTIRLDVELGGAVEGQRERRIAQQRRELAPRHAAYEQRRMRRLALPALRGRHHAVRVEPERHGAERDAQADLGRRIGPEPQQHALDTTERRAVAHELRVEPIDLRPRLAVELELGVEREPAQADEADRHELGRADLEPAHL
jgi:hypothetical protein